MKQPFERAYAILRNFAAESNTMHSLDLCSPFLEEFERNGNLWDSITCCDPLHWTAAGNELIARIIADFLLDL